MLVTKERRSSTKWESILTKQFQTPTPPKSKLYKTPKNSVQNSKSKIRGKKNTNTTSYTMQKCHDPQCNSNYMGQTKCRLLKRVIQHNKHDKSSNLLIHSNDKSHHRVWLDDFEIIRKGFKSNFKRQISEALHIKEKVPDLNIQKDAYRLSLYS